MRWPSGGVAMMSGLVALAVGCSGSGRPPISPEKMGSPFGEIEAEALTTQQPGSDGGATMMVVIDARFSSEWPDCRSDQVPAAAPGSCCFVPGTTLLPSADIGTLTMRFGVIDFTGDEAVEPVRIAFNDADGNYGATPSLGVNIGIDQLVGVGWPGGVVAPSVVPAFNDTDLNLTEGPVPVLTPDLGELSVLSTTKDWTVPLMASQIDAGFEDRVIIDSDEVGEIICETNDEGAALMPGLVVPAALLASFSGHTGTVTVYRDDYSLVDAGAMVVGIRLGAGLGTATNAVSFTP